MDGNFQKFMDIENELLKEAEIVMCTLNTSGKRKYREFYTGSVFCLIIDEAAQATEPSTLVPLQTGVKKVLLVGDHKQLPPTVMSKNAWKTKYSRSLFERRIDHGDVPYLLDTQYRMVSELREFPSQSFYKNQLKDGRKHDVPKILRLNSAEWFIDIAYGK